MAGPAPSLPDRDTTKVALVVVDGSVWTALVVGLASIVFVICGVAMAALVSKTMLAWAFRVAPVTRPALGWIV
jgi:hypothetical protein